MYKNILNFFKRYRSEEEGATAVEFGLIGIPFLLILFGIMESGRMMWTMNGIQYAVEDTSRYAALNPTLGTADYQTYAAGKLQEMLVPSDDLQITSSTVTSSGVDFVEISASYDHATMLNGFLPAEFGSMTLRSAARKPVIN